MSGPRKFILTPSWRVLGKALGRADRRSAFVKHVVRDQRLRDYVLTNMSKICKNEIKQLCSESSFLKSTQQDVCSFSWSHVCEELKKKSTMHLVSPSVLHPSNKYLWQTGNCWYLCCHFGEGTSTVCLPSPEDCVPNIVCWTHKQTG